MKRGKALLAVLAGIAAGAVIGVLFAPDKGEKLKAAKKRNRAELADLLTRLEARFDTWMAELAARKPELRRNGEVPSKPELPVS